MAMQTVITAPDVPFLTFLEGGLKPGMMVVVDGYVSPDSDRFEINFAVGSNMDEPGRSDIAFHFNPRFNEKYVARNSYENGQWAHEEGKNPANNPLSRDDVFNIIILIEFNAYRVAINGDHFLEFKHRIPLGNVTSLYVMGGVSLHKIVIQQPYVPCIQTTDLPIAVLHRPAIPFKYGIELTQGKIIKIKGRPTQIVDRFRVDFTSANGDIPFHFTPRFQEGECGQIVRNTLNAGEWGDEERDMPYFPFTAGLEFEMQIIVEASEYLVAINGQHFVSYPHRLPYCHANFIEINGDIMVSEVAIY